MSWAGQASTSILLLTYNNERDIGGCLRALREQSRQDFQLLATDNRSVDATADVLNATGLPFTQNHENVGYARGMNQMLALVKTPYVVLLNADCQLDKDFLSRAIGRLEESPQLDAIAPLVWRTQDRDKLDSGPVAVRKTMRVNLDRDIETARECHKANGACPVFRMATLRALETQSGYLGFDETFDTYGEDIDLALRLERLGARTFFDPSVQAVHQRSASSGAVSILEKKGRLRTNVVAGRHLNAAGHQSWYWLSVVWPVLLTQDVALMAIGLIKGDLAVVGDVLRAWRRAAGHARVKRQEVQRIQRLRPPA